MKNYRDRLYTGYVTTHTLHRKGEATVEDFRQRAALYTAQFAMFLPPHKDARILDAGCGNGSVVWWLQQKMGFGNSEGIDVSREQIDAAEKLGVKNLTRADLEEFFRGNKKSYEVIFLRDILEHIDKDSVLGVLDSIYGALSPGGAVILQVPNAESPFGGRIRYGDFTHETAFTSSSLSQVLRAAGFGAIEFHSTGPRVLGVKSLIRVLLWKFAEAFYKLLLFAELGRGTRVVSQGIIAAARRDAGR